MNHRSFEPVDRAKNSATSARRGLSLVPSARPEAVGRPASKRILSAIAIAYLIVGDIEHRRAELLGQLPNLTAHFLRSRASRLLSGSSIKES
jgi:hypothetical protein